MTDDANHNAALRASMRAGLSDFAERFARQIDEAADRHALYEIVERLSAVSNLLTSPPAGHHWRVVASVT